MSGLRYVVFALLLAAVGPRASHAAAMISDVQVQSQGEARYEIAIRSTAAQAFDVAPAGRAGRVTVRLHQTGLGRIATPGRAAFGRVKLRARRDGDVIARLRLRRGWTARVRQGGSPDMVVIRVER